ncbi:MAG: leucine--tRNA ligase [Phycisphaeraceae bacterium]|nr:leucine--tRNA ligase [Phycisphaeraceae bacterium]
MSTPPSTTTGNPRDDIPPHRYDARLADQIETKWQRFWEEHGTFVQPNPGQPGFDASRPKFYCLDMFPYPSGAGLHVGHPLSYTATDIVSRFMRMKGHNVLHPMGWDAFGLPAEQYAIQTGIHPAITTRQATDNFRRQLKRFGFSYDWSREVSTIDPEYYKWTQWIFLRAYDSWYDASQPAGGGGGRARPIAELIAELESGDLRIGFDGDLVHVGSAATTGIIGGEPVGTRRWHELSADEQRAVIDSQRLAYIDEATVNWCPKLGTVLANDEVIDGRSERGGHPVLRKPLRQWMFRITAYAERLLRDLDTVDWPASTKAMQSEWIGRSEGAEVDFALRLITDRAEVELQSALRVFTTRPDTLFGATFMVVAPEHPIVEAALGAPDAAFAADAAVLRAYVAAARNRSDVDRMADTRDKTGVFTGLHCENPATGELIPIWTADYVLMGYGHGAIMAVPAHDERDFAFAKKFNLPIRDVVYPRTHLLIGFYARHATREEIDSGAWKSVLADFLGLAATGDMKPEMFGAVLDAVRTRREQPPPAGEGAERLTPRGVIAGEYIDAIESFGTFHELRGQFHDAAVFAAAGAAFSGHGYAVNSANADVTLDLLPTVEAKQRIIDWLEKTGRGNRKVNYKLRDWAFSRQRYWGEPFPIVFDEQGRHYPVAFEALPVTLPELADYSPVESDDPMPLLAKAADWMNTTAGAAGVSPDVLPPHTPVRRETNTMPGSAGSSWYFVRYCDAKNRERFVGAEAERYWMGGRGVDLYIGGSEHAVGHLLYSRFWQKLLFDLGEVDSPEPFARLFHQGLITSFAYQRADKTIVPTDEVRDNGDGTFSIAATGERVTPVVTKMSKRYKNVVNPDDVIAEFGADTFRLYEMYMGPLDQSKPWNTRDAVGIFRFLQRLWRLAIDEQTGALRLRDEPLAQVEKQLHRAAHKVAADLPKLAFNTAIAALIEFVNVATSAAGSDAALTRDQLRRIALVLAPFAPHMAEELWSRLGHTASLAYEAFPEADPAMLTDNSVEVPVQVGGKIRAKVRVATGADHAAHEAAAMAEGKVQAALAGKAIKKIVVVPGKMINIVAGE